MKLIKQNDSAGGLIFKQNQNGKAMKQNYNFGKGYFGGITCRIEFPAEEDLNSKSMMFFHKNKRVTSPNNIEFYNLVNTKVFSYLSLNVYFSIYFNIGINVYIGDLEENETRHQSFVFKDNQCTAYSKGNTSVSTANSYTQRSIKYVTVRVQKVTDLIFYDKVVTQDERDYHFNNLLGNDPLSLLGCKFFLKFEMAEILDFGGVIGEAVGVRDYSGNEIHGRIIGLPSGTLQEQLDYANANLFEPW